MIEYDPNLSSCTSPPPNKEPEDCGATTHATEEPKKERPAETPVLHKLSNSKEVVMFFENIWRVELELEGDIGPRRRTLEILRDQGIAGDILFSFDTKQELIDNLKEGGISHFLAIAVADQVSLQKADVFQQLKDEVARHKIVEFLPLPHEGAPRIVKPPHDIDRRLSSPVIGRSTEVAFVLKTIVDGDYLERPVLFQCLNMSGMGKTFFGLRLADQLFQQCQPLSQPAEDWKSKLAVIDKEILSEFDENTLRLIHAHTMEAVLAPHPRTNSGSGAQPTESLQAVCNEATLPVDRQPGRESDSLSKWRSKLVAVYQQIISELGQDTLNLILAVKESTNSTEWDPAYLQAIRNGGTTVMMDWNGSGSHDTLHPVERKSDSLATSPEEMAYAFVCLRLLARLDNKWAQEFITQYNITPRQYMSLSTVGVPQIAEMLAKLAGHSNRNGPSLLVFHFDESQILLDNVTPWNEATPARPEWTTKFNKAVYLRICGSRKELWNKYKILLVVIQTGTMSQCFNPTELTLKSVPLSCLSVSSVLKTVPRLTKFFDDNGQLVELEMLLQSFGFVAFLLPSLQKFANPNKSDTPSKMLGAISKRLELRLEDKTNALPQPKSEDEGFALLANCYHALARMPLPVAVTDLLAGYREGGFLIGRYRGDDFYPASVPSVLEFYRCKVKKASYPNLWFLVTALDSCLVPFKGTGEAHAWENQVRYIIAARVLCRQYFRSEPLLWKEILPGLTPFDGCTLNTHFLSAMVQTKVSTMEQFNTKNGSTTGAHDHNNTSFLYLTCNNQKGFDVGLNDGKFICLLQAKDYAEGAYLSKENLKPFLEQCVEVANHHSQKTVVGIIVAKRTMQKLSTKRKSRRRKREGTNEQGGSSETDFEDYLPNPPKNLALYYISNAREYLVSSRDLEIPPSAV